jgi:glutamate formiminotransferase/formiminotetrahydrofolate cyclodeaminase
MKQLIECVPNFSEGRDMSIIKQITDVIETVEGVKLLDVDPGFATNRTVVTFAGEPEAVCEAAFRAMKKASEVIDMSKHKGAHPRFGATDVCPLVPVKNIDMAETAKFARALAERVGKELDYPVYCYEAAAFSPERKNLAHVRAGEYEALPEKLKKPENKPDFGPAEFRPKNGATAVGARDFLVAVNFNLNTKSVKRANSVAFDVREQGRVLKDTNDKTLTDENGEPLRQPGTCRGTKAIGWFIDEYGLAQVSMNITDIAATPLHVAFEEVRKSADRRGMRVTGTEIVGLVPLRVLTDAGKYFLRQQNRSEGANTEELLFIAVKSMGLDDLKPFEPKERILEYLIAEASNENLVSMNLKKFADETASEAPAPGGGSVSAYVGALGASLGAMVASLSAQKYTYQDGLEDFSSRGLILQKCKEDLIFLTDEDTRAYNGIMEAFKLPKNTDEEKAARKKAVDDATKNAIIVPLNVMRAAYAGIKELAFIARNGNQNAISDAGVAAATLRTAIYGAFLNVKINCKGLKDERFVRDVVSEAESIYVLAISEETNILDIVQACI